MIAQKTVGTLHFKNGDIQKGFVKLAGSQSVKFKSNKNAKAIKYEFADLEYAEIYNGDESSIYKNVIVLGKEKPIVLEEIVQGRVTLYNLHTQAYTSGFSPMGVRGAPMYTGRNFYSLKNLYVKKEDENQAIHLGSNQLFTKNFKTAASDFFKDCPTLVEKIQTKEFKKKEIKAIVEYYNTYCD